MTMRKKTYKIELKAAGEDIIAQTIKNFHKVKDIADVIKSSFYHERK